MSKHTPEKIQVGYNHGSPSMYDVYTVDGDFVAANDAGCKEFATELSRRYNAHTEMLEALKRLVERIDHNDGLGAYRGGPAFVLKDVRAAIKLAEGE